MIAKLRQMGEEGLSSIVSEAMTNKKLRSGLGRAGEKLMANKSSFDRNVESMLDFVNIPSKKDVRDLKQRLDHLRLAASEPQHQTGSRARRAGSARRDQADKKSSQALTSFPRRARFRAKLYPGFLGFGQFAVGSFGIFSNCSKNKLLDYAGEFAQSGSFWALFWSSNFRPLCAARKTKHKGTKEDGLGGWIDECGWSREHSTGMRQANWCRIVSGLLPPDQFCTKRIRA